MSKFEDMSTPCYQQGQFFENGNREWLTTRQAADYLGITANALRIRVSRKTVKFFKFGRKLRFKKRDLRSLLRFKGGRK